MENNEIMEYEDIEVNETDIVADGGSSLGTGAAMLIGAGLALAVSAGVKLVKKGISAFKKKKELRQPEDVIDVEPEDVEEIVAE